MTAAPVDVDELLDRCGLSRPTWMTRAACRGADAGLFFSGRGAHASKIRDHAREVCARCPVRHECAEHAINEHIGFGIWGGLTEQERRKIRRARRQPTEEDT